MASGSMAFAYFDVHQSGALWPIQNGGEMSAIFCWSFLLLVFTGSRAFGLDRLLAFRSVTAAGPASDPVTA